ncbi:MAG: glycerol-3-phosphate acyltransferase [Ignavibacteriales bacterium]|nr:glycerol-3-phosphate acyltransferase [Ignavibacteriales bacterium]
MHLLICVLGGYLLGSIPTAYLLVRRSAGIDIREAGSGNVGGYNTYRVTKSKSAAVMVGVLDGLKGFGAVLVVAWFAPESPWDQVVVLGSTLVGHNYPVWLGFKGGRGLASAAGGFLGIGLSFAVVWCGVWFVVHRTTNDILKSNITAIVVSPFIVAALRTTLVPWLMVSSMPPDVYVLASIPISCVLLLSHAKPVWLWIQGKPLS